MTTPNEPAEGPDVPLALVNDRGSAAAAADGDAAPVAEGQSAQDPPAVADSSLAEQVDGLAAIQADLARLTATVEEIRANLREVDEFHVLRAKDRQLIEQLHTENTELNQGQLATAMRPLFNGLIKLYDLMTPVRDDDPSMKMLRAQVVQVLDLNGVELYRPKPGEAFDSKRQQGTRATDTEDPAADATVAHLTRVGFLRGDVVMRPALVEVYRLRKPADSSSAR